jgi:hypothetical protein
MLSENISGHPKDWSNSTITCSVADGATQQNSGALLLYDGPAGNFRQVQNDGGPKTLADGDEFLYSFSVKSVDQQWVILRFLDGATNVLRFWLDIQNNDISNLTTDSTIIEDSSVFISESTSNNEWITCYIWFKVKSATTFDVFHYFADSAGSFNGTTSQGNSYYLSELVVGKLDVSNKGQINDAKISFWSGKGYTGTYNDMQKQWLIELYSSGGFALTNSSNGDLLYRYNKIIDRI